jgi:excisionase family DNA binding protein
MSDWLTAQEAAIPLRCSVPTVTRMAKSGQFTKVKWAGNQVRIHRSEVYPAAEPATTATPDPAPVLRLVAEIEQRLTDLKEMVMPPIPDRNYPQLVEWEWTRS